MRGYLRKREGRRADYWELEVDAGRDPATGRRRRVVRSFTGSKSEAEAALAELVHDVNRGKGRGTETTVDDLLVRWLAMIAETHSPTTIREYSRLVDARIRPVLGAVQLRRLEVVDLDTWYAKLTAEGLAAGSVRRIHALLHRALDQAVRWGWIPKNPASHATPPPARRKHLQPPSPDRVVQLIAAAKKRGDGTLGVFLHLAAVTGARRGEICGLRWADVDWEHRALLIERSIAGNGATLVEKSTKTHSSRRIALDASTVTLLASHRDAMSGRADSAGMALRPDAFVLSDDLDGARPWRPDRVTLAFTRLCDREEVRDVRLHDLRHFAATRLLGAGVDVRTVSGRLGHANPATTLNVYSHFLEARDQAAADVLGGLLEAPGEA